MPVYLHSGDSSAVVRTDCITCKLVIYHDDFTRTGADDLICCGRIDHGAIVYRDRCSDHYLIRRGTCVVASCAMWTKLYDIARDMPTYATDGSDTPASGSDNHPSVN